MANYLSGISSPISCSNTKQNSLPSLKKPKRITVILSECQSFQSSLVFTKKSINKSSSDYQKYLKIIKKQVDKDPIYDQFKEEYEKKRKSNNEKEKIKSGQLTDFQLKIESLLKNTNKSEKFKLKRTKSRNIEKNLANDFIEPEELRNPEALKILKSNKRVFGEGFRGKDDKLGFRVGKLTGYASGIKIDGKTKNFGIAKKDKANVSNSKGRSKFSWV